MNFPRGTVIHHKVMGKVMGKGMAIKEIDDNGEKKVEVRMANGHIEKFYPEELESDDEVQTRQRRQIDEDNRANEERGKRLDPFS